MKERNSVFEPFFYLNVPPTTVTLEWNAQVYKKEVVHEILVNYSEYIAGSGAAAPDAEQFLIIILGYD